MKESLFELIRKEEVIIWAGAGLSHYAGFPSGTELSKILFDSLSNDEKKLINPNLLLSDLAEEYYRIKGNNKNSLLRILNKYFIDEIPESTIYHDKLATIPHFKTIITTNYDKLLENSLHQKGQVVTSSKHIPYLDKEKTHIFKVHGDLSEPDSIILTKTDYNNFFKNDTQTEIFWTVIKERLSTKCVLFLGYNLEDQNVSIIFEKITESLQSHRKECFLVSPNLSKHKINDLIKKNIHYINSTAEELIESLIVNLKENIINDLENGLTSADTFRNFLLNYNLLPELIGGIDTYTLHSLKGINGKVFGIMNLKLKSDPELKKELNEFITGKKFGDFEISEEKLIDANISYGGLKFPNSEGIVKLKFQSTPKIVSKIDIQFENGYVLNNIPVKLYGSISIIEIHIELKNALLKVNLDISNLPETKVNFNYKHNEICTKTNEEIELFNLLKNLGSGQQFKIYTQSGKTYTKNFQQMPLFIEEAEYFLEYFENLRLIEKHYLIQFLNININSISESTFELVKKVVSVINKTSTTSDWDDELQMELIDFSEHTIEQLKKVNELKAPVVANHKLEEEIEIHGQKLNLGYKKIEFLESYISNLDSIINKNEKIARIKSLNKKIIITYSVNRWSE